MEGQLMGWVINIICGAVGGNVVGAVLRQFSLGPIGNTIAGVVGGGLGGQIVGGAMGSGLLGSILGSGVGGGVLMVVVGLIKKMMARS